MDEEEDEDELINQWLSSIKVVTPESVPLAGFASVKRTKMTHRIGPVFAPAHAGPLESLSYDRFAG